MAIDKKKKFIEGYEEWSKNLEESAKGAPQTDEEIDAAVKEFEQEWDAMSEEEREGHRAYFREREKRRKEFLKEKKEEELRQKKTTKGQRKPLPKRKELTV